MKAGAQWIEADIKLTADGVPVLLHDDVLARTTNGQGPVADIAWADLQKLDAGSWFGKEFANVRVPMLSELLVFARDAGLRLNLELKPCPGRTRATTMIALIEIVKIWPENAYPPLISSFDIEALTIAAQLHPAAPRGLLLEDWREDWREAMFETHAATLHVNAELLTPARLSLLTRMHVPVLAYTVNDPAQAKSLLGDGVRAIFCDDPGTMLKALGSALTFERT